MYVEHQLQDNILLILHDSAKNKQRTEFFAEKKICRDMGEFPLQRILSWDKIRHLIGDFLSTNSVRDLVTRLRKLIF